MAKVLGVLGAALVAWALTATAALAEHGRWQQVENKANCAVWNGNPEPNETVTWSGACATGKAQGRGAQVWRYLEDGEWKTDKYKGEMKGGKKHGRGVYVWADGARYEGDWKDGTRQGRGVYEFASGSRYEGDWKDGKEHGRGVKVWENSDRYEGDWKDGKRTGRGVIVTANGDECGGEWREDRLLGTGTGRENGQIKKCYLDGNTIQYTD